MQERLTWTMPKFRTSSPTTPLYSAAIAIFIATGIMVVATFGEYALGTLAPVLGNELGISPSLVGTLTSVMFASAGAASLPSGWMVDRLSTNWLVLFQVLAAAAALAAFALLRSTAHLVVISVATGLIMAMCNPLTNKLVRFHLSPSLHAAAVGWKSIGPQLGALLSGVIYGVFVNAISWRAVTLAIAGTMAAFGAMSFALVRTWAPVYPDDRDVNDEPEPPERTRPIVWWLVPFCFFSGGAIASVGAFVPVFAYRSHGMSFAAASGAGALVALAGVVGRLVWVRLLKRDNGPALLIKASACSAVAASLLAVSVYAHPGVFWVAVVLTGVTALGMSPLAQILVVRNASAEHIGVASAWVGMGLYGGFTFQPWLIGALTDRVGFSHSWFAISGSSVVAALIMVAYLSSVARRTTVSLSLVRDDEVPVGRHSS